jgi:peptide/nickel transport system ATP-binding protein
MKLAIDLQDLSIDIDTPRGALHAVRRISLSVERGKTMCIVGESGCGKSMTALSLMGLLPRAARKSASRMVVAGVDVTKSDKALKSLRGDRLAMIFQEPMTALNPSYTIGNQLTEVHRRHRASTRKQARERAIQILEMVGITSAEQRLSQYPHQLSGGLRQRVMIAMALMCEPDILIADEPTTALDVTIQAQILQLLAGLKAELGLTLVLITHDLGVVARVADDVAVMYAGEIVEAGRAADVFTRPAHPYTHGLLAAIPIRGKTPPGSHLGVIPGSVPSLIGKMEGCAFRSRCAHARAECEKPVPLRHDGDHTWRCVLETPAAMEVA